MKQKGQKQDAAKAEPSKPKVLLKEKIWPMSKDGLCVEDCQVLEERDGKLVPCVRTCVISEAHSTKNCRCRVHQSRLSVNRKDLEELIERKGDAIKHILDLDLEAKGKLIIIPSADEAKDVERQIKDLENPVRKVIAGESTSSSSRRRFVIDEDTRPFSFTVAEKKQIKEEYEREKLRRAEKEKTSESSSRQVRLKVVRLKGIKTDEKTAEDRRQKGENDRDEAASEGSFPDEDVEDVAQVKEEEFDDEDILKDFQEQLDQDERSTDEDQEIFDESIPVEPIPLKQMMIFVMPLKNKKSSEVEVAIKEIILYIERKLKYKVDRLHTDPGTELNTQRMREWCANQSIRKTNSVPEDVKANGTVESAVGLIKKQTRAIIEEAKVSVELWPFAAIYAAKQRERFILSEEPLLKFGTKVIVKKRTSRNRRVKSLKLPMVIMYW